LTVETIGLTLAEGRGLLRASTSIAMMCYSFNDRALYFRPELRTRAWRAAGEFGYVGNAAAAARAVHGGFCAR
jgi:hypothetical protein